MLAILTSTFVKPNTQNVSTISTIIVREDFTILAKVLTPFLARPDPMGTTHPYCPTNPCCWIFQLWLQRKLFWLVAMLSLRSYNTRIFNIIISENFFYFQFKQTVQHPHLH